MDILRLKRWFVRLWTGLAMVSVFGLAGCQTQPTLETTQQWSRAGNDNYVNNDTGTMISRQEYGKLVAAESYYFLSAREGNSNKAYCPR